MKKNIIIGLLVLIAVTNVNAQVNEEDSFGLGVILGEPTGFTFKYWVDKEHAVDGGLGYSFVGDEGLVLHADYLLYDYKINNSEQWPAYYGIGAILELEEDNGKKHDGETNFGFRVPFGMSYFFEHEEPYEFFIEFAPVLELAPDLGIGINAAVGLRFYF